MTGKTRGKLAVTVCAALALALMLAAPVLAGIFLTKAQTVKDGVDGLDAPFAVAVSPDGKFVYIGAMQDNGIAVLERNATSGVLTPTQFVQDGVGGVTPGALSGLTTLAISPDGNHLYAGGTGGMVGVFGRDATTGHLTFVEAKRNGAGGVPNFLFFGITNVTLDPAGEYVYVTSTGNAPGTIPGAVTTFKRDAATGTLSFVQAKQDGRGDVPDGLFGASSVTLSPDGNFAYVTSSLDRMGRGDNSLLTFRRETVSGTLSYVGIYKDPTVLYGASGGTISPDGNYFYATGGGNPLLGRPGTLAMFTREMVSGTLSLTEVYTDGVGGVDGLNKALGIAISPDGNNIYVAGKEDDALAVFTRTVNGRLTFVEVQRDGVGGVDGLDAALAVTVSPDGEHVYALGEYDDAVAVFDRDAMTGALSFVKADRGWLAGLNGLNGATAVGISPDGKYAYATGMYDGAVAVFSRDAGTGALTYVEFKRDGVGFIDGLDGAYAIALSPNDNGKHVYIASYYDNALAVFSRDVASGTLAFVEFYQDGVGGVDGLEGANSVMVSPDGKQVYATSQYDSAVAVFSRNATTGRLTFIAAYKDGENGLDGLAAARSAAVSPDGKNVYVASFSDNAVALFGRDAPTGTLSYMGIITDVNMFGAESIAVSPDDKNVYVSCMQSKALEVFSRDTTSGWLTAIEVHKDDSATPPGTDDGLDTAKSVAVSPDGQYVYVVSQGTDHALVVFSRDAATGKLTYREAFRDMLYGGNVDGLNTPMNVTVSPDSQHIYIASKVSDGVVVFSHNNTHFEKSVTPQGQVNYGDELTYTLTLSATPGTRLNLYDPLKDVTFVRFLAQPAGVQQAGNIVTGTLAVTPSNQLTLSFVVWVGVPGTLGWTVTVTNRACVYPLDGSINNCAWSNEVINPAFHPYRIYLPIVMRNA
ncbi:MAG: beta-propeller fold lactonase family protein [Thermoflexales bacterium]|nr:beta-propeller fold lactonase family protein [Thermoflexales bacterium]